MKDIICIVCPKGCALRVDESNDYEVTGYGCKRGIAYGQEEARSPKRVITSTVAIRGGDLPRCPVKLDSPIPKQDIFRAMEALESVCLQAPVEVGDVVVEGVCGTDANFVATRKMAAR